MIIVFQFAGYGYLPLRVETDAFYDGPLAASHAYSAPIQFGSPDMLMTGSKPS